MLLKEISTEIDLSYIELLKKIDIGEFNLYMNASSDDLFKRWFFRYAIVLKNNCGIFTGSLYDDQMHIQISFKHDPEEDISGEVYRIIKDTFMKQPAMSIHLWINNENIRFVERIKQQVRKINYMVMTHEYHFDLSKLSSKNTQTLHVTPYDEKYLEALLVMLEESFTGIAEKGEFISHKSHFNHLFSNQINAATHLFFFNHILVGMYHFEGGRLEYIATHKAYQKKGFGSIILNHALHHMKHLNILTPVLYCVDSNLAAHQFYQKEGWTITARSIHMSLTL